MASVAKGPKHKRSSRACDRCYKKACKCHPGIEGTPCTRCTEGGMACTYSRQVKRRGPRSRRLRAAMEAEADADHESEPSIASIASMADIASIAVPTHTPTPTASLTCSPPRTGSGSVRLGSAMSQTSHVPTTSMTTATTTPYDESIISPELLQRLTLDFYHASYPTRPYFHWPTFQTQIQQQAYRNDRGVFVVAMAVCAVSAARIAHGLTINMPWESWDTSLSATDAAAVWTRCYSAAANALPTDTDTVGDTDYISLMKASALLASACLQGSDLKRTLSHLGYYVSLSVQTGFYNENNWPPNLDEIQKQERRRLFWGVYQQEQYVCNDFGLVSRQREAQATVLYPAEVVSDEDITAAAVHIRTGPGCVSFLRGWNFCTSLYRLLENINSSARRRGAEAKGSEVVEAQEADAETDIHSFLSRFAPPPNFAPDSLQFIASAYADLPPELKLVRAVTTTTGEDSQIQYRYSVIACNVLVTTQILKMLLVGTGPSSIQQRCAIAGELLDELSNVPLTFFHATSISSIRHLAHVGHMLASAVQGPFESAWTFLQVRSTLRVLADFLETIEIARGTSPHLSVKLRGQIDRIDNCMRRASVEQNSAAQIQTQTQTLLQHWLQRKASSSTTPLASQPAQPTASVPQPHIQQSSIQQLIQQTSPPPSVTSNPRPQYMGGSSSSSLRPFEAADQEDDHQSQQQASSHHSHQDPHNHFDHQHSLSLHHNPNQNQPHPQPPTTFRDTGFDFILPGDHNAGAFSLDPLENWPLALGDPDQFDGIPISSINGSNMGGSTMSGTTMNGG